MINKLIYIWRGATFLWACALIVAIAWTPVSVSYVDQRFFPVITQFNVTNIDIKPEGWYLSGNMYKPKWRSNCDLVDVIASINDSRQHELFSNRDLKIFTRSSGWSNFNAWFIPGSHIDHIQIYSRHICHKFWQNSTALWDSADHDVVSVTQPNIGNHHEND